MARPLRAVIFDVDGVLVRSMEKHHAAYQRAFDTVGARIGQDEVFEHEGRRNREVVERLAEARRLGLPKEKLDELSRIKQETFRSFGPMPFYPGARELVESLHARGLKVAAVTGTSRANVDHHLGDLVRRFSAIVAGEDYENGKPHPEPYRRALDKLGIAPDEAVVVENAVLGIRSAKAAGLRVIAVASTMPREALREADVIVGTIGDVAAAIGGE